MPCFSACNVRFVSAEAQLKQKCQELRARAQTAAYRPPPGGYRPGTSYNAAGGGAAGFVSFRRRSEQFATFDQKQLKRNERERRRNQGKKELVLRPSELKRLKDQGKVLTIDEQFKAIERSEQQHEQQLQLVEQTKQRYKQMDAARQADAKAEQQVEQDEHDGLLQQNTVLSRAFLAKQEQEEEVKQINRMILDAKCKAVREAQIQEKQLLAKALREDDERLAKMVNARAQQALNAEDERERLELEKRAKYAQEIRKQLSERENQRFQQAQRVAAEAKQLKQAGDLLREEEQRQRGFVELRKRRFREELQRIRDMSSVFKNMLCEQERLAELRVAAYMREKQEKERQLKDMQLLAKKEFERRQQRIYTLAAEAQIIRQTAEELKYLKDRNRVEREYRQREKQAAMSKREAERDLAASRAQQAQELKQRLAQEISEAEQQFNKMLERLRQEEEQQRSLDKQREQQSQVYRRDLKQQMTQRQAERQRLAQLEHERMQKWLEQERQRDVNIKQVISSKINAMRENCLPDKYLKEVEKQLKHIDASRNRIR
ncbi:CG11449 [Drosophila busckii]|uniref:Cilia- and flagella-associated protein 45 n=1 Tax=Drosophila busckii TaxID=30019 RepID=A0A0M4ELE5_DROBS|nr:cilia- and flagella-associated protein 45 [Drosophila busckii]ALC44260.1 CG11449 [Drosophila busckii]